MDDKYKRLRGIKEAQYNEEREFDSSLGATPIISIDAANTEYLSESDYTANLNNQTATQFSQERQGWGSAAFRTIAAGGGTFASGVLDILPNIGATLWEATVGEDDPNKTGLQEVLDNPVYNMFSKMNEEWQQSEGWKRFYEQKDFGDGYMFSGQMMDDVVQGLAFVGSQYVLGRGVGLLGKFAGSANKLASTGFATMANAINKGQKAGALSNNLSKLARTTSGILKSKKLGDARQILTGTVLSRYGEGGMEAYQKGKELEKKLKPLVEQGYMSEEEYNQRLAKGQENIMAVNMALALTDAVQLGKLFKTKSAQKQIIDKYVKAGSDFRVGSKGKLILPRYNARVGNKNIFGSIDVADVGKRLVKKRADKIAKAAAKGKKKAPKPLTQAQAERKIVSNHIKRNSALGLGFTMGSEAFEEYAQETAGQVANQAAFVSDKELESIDGYDMFRSTITKLADTNNLTSNKSLKAMVLGATVGGIMKGSGIAYDMIKGTGQKTEIQEAQKAIDTDLTDTGTGIKKETYDKIKEFVSGLQDEEQTRTPADLYEQFAKLKEEEQADDFVTFVDNEEIRTLRLELDETDQALFNIEQELNSEEKVPEERIKELESKRKSLLRRKTILEEELNSEDRKNAPQILAINPKLEDSYTKSELTEMAKVLNNLVKSDKQKTNNTVLDIRDVYHYAARAEATGFDGLRKKELQQLSKDVQTGQLSEQELLELTGSTDTEVAKKVIDERIKLFDKAITKIKAKNRVLENYDTPAERSFISNKLDEINQQSFVIEELEKPYKKKAVSVDEKTYSIFEEKLGNIISELKSEETNSLADKFNILLNQEEFSDLKANGIDNIEKLNKLLNSTNELPSIDTLVQEIEDSNDQFKFTGLEDINLPELGESIDPNLTGTKEELSKVLEDFRKNVIASSPQMKEKALELKLSLAQSFFEEGGIRERSITQLEKQRESIHKLFDLLVEQDMDNLEREDGLPLNQSDRNNLFEARIRKSKLNATKLAGIEFEKMSPEQRKEYLNQKLISIEPTNLLEDIENNHSIGDEFYDLKDLLDVDNELARSNFEKYLEYSRIKDKADALYEIDVNGVIQNEFLKDDLYKFGTDSSFRDKQTGAVLPLAYNIRTKTVEPISETKLKTRSSSQLKELKVLSPELASIFYNLESIKADGVNAGKSLSINSNLDNDSKKQTVEEISSIIKQAKDLKNEFISTLENTNNSEEIQSAFKSKYKENIEQLRQVQANVNNTVSQETRDKYKKNDTTPIKVSNDTTVYSSTIPDVSDGNWNTYALNSNVNQITGVERLTEEPEELYLARAAGKVGIEVDQLKKEVKKEKRNAEKVRDYFNSTKSTEDDVTYTLNKDGDRLFYKPSNANIRIYIPRGENIENPQTALEANAKKKYNSHQTLMNKFTDGNTSIPLVKQPSIDRSFKPSEATEENQSGDNWEGFKFGTGKGEIELEINNSTQEIYLEDVSTRKKAELRLKDITDPKKIKEIATTLSLIMANNEETILSDGKNDLTPLQKELLHQASLLVSEKGPHAKRGENNAYLSKDKEGIHITTKAGVKEKLPNKPKEIEAKLLELVNTGAIKIRPSVQLSKLREDGNYADNLREWLIDNNAELYYDMSKPINFPIVKAYATNFKKKRTSKPDSKKAKTSKSDSKKTKTSKPTSKKAKLIERLHKGIGTVIKRKYSDKEGENFVNALLTYIANKPEGEGGKEIIDQINEAFETDITELVLNKGILRAAEKLYTEIEQPSETEQPTETEQPSDELTGVDEAEQENTPTQPEDQSKPANQPLEKQQAKAPAFAKTQPAQPQGVDNESTIENLEDDFFDEIEKDDNALLKQELISSKVITNNSIEDLDALLDNESVKNNEELSNILTKLKTLKDEIYTKVEPSIDAKKAEIERRKKEEIGTKESRSYKDDNGVTWTVEIQTLADRKVVRARTDENGESIQASPNTYPKELSNNKIYEVENPEGYHYSKAIEVETKGKRTDQINAKYEAEVKKNEERKQNLENPKLNTIIKHDNISDSFIEENVSESEKEKIAQEENIDKSKVLDLIKSKINNIDYSGLGDTLTNVLSKLKKIIASVLAIGGLYIGLNNNIVETNAQELSNVRGYATYFLAREGVINIGADTIKVDIIEEDTTTKIKKDTTTKIKKDTVEYKVPTYTKVIDKVADRSSTDSLFSYRSQWNNNDGFEYILTHKKENKALDKTNSWTDVIGVGHFIIDNDVSDRYNGSYHKGWIPTFRKSSGDRYILKYKKSEDLLKEDIVFTPLVQFNASNINWQKTKPIYKSAQQIVTKDGKPTGLLYGRYKEVGNRNSYGRFNGNSVVFIFEKNGKVIVRDFAGSINQIKNELELIKSEFDLSDKDITLGRYDAGSFSAKPVAKKGTLTRNQWDHFNPKDGGAAMIIPKKMSIGSDVQVTRYSNKGIDKLSKPALDAYRSIKDIREDSIETKCNT